MKNSRKRGSPRQSRRRRSSPRQSRRRRTSPRQSRRRRSSPRQSRRRRTSPRQSRRRKTSPRQSRRRKTSPRQSRRRRTYPRQSRRRRASPRQSRRRRTSPRQSRRRRNIVYRFDGDNEKCISSIKQIDINDIEKSVKLLLESQDKRLMIADKLRANKVTFGMFKRSKTRYGEKFIYNTPSDIIKLNKYIRAKSETLNKYIRATSVTLVEILKKKITETDKKAFVFQYIDVGIRITGYDVTHNLIFVLNAMAMGFYATQDWQQWLGSPAAILMLSGIVNDRNKLLDFINMIQTASIMGVTETDMFAQLPRMGFDICDPKRYEIFSSLVIGNGINMIARRGQIAVLGMIEKKIAENV